MSTTTQNKPAANGAKTSNFEHKEDTGTLFYDQPGVPTLSGSIKHGKVYRVTGEPQVDKNQRDYVKVSGDGASGALYVNDRKQSDNHPDFTGPIEVGGEKMRMSAWKKVTKSGKNAGSEFLSVALSWPRQASED